MTAVSLSDTIHDMKLSYSLKLDRKTIKNLEKMAKENRRQPREFLRLLVEDVVDNRASVQLSFLSKS